MDPQHQRFFPFVKEDGQHDIAPVVADEAPEGGHAPDEQVLQGPPPDRPEEKQLVGYPPQHHHSLVRLHSDALRLEEEDIGSQGQQAQAEHPLKVSAYLVR